MRKILFIIFATLLFNQIIAQNKTVISFSPCYLFNFGMRMDIDKQIKNGWLVFAPQIYYADRKDYEDAFYTYSDENDRYGKFYYLRGVGLDVNYRKYFLGEGPQGVYAGGGLLLKYYKIKYASIFYKEISEDGLNYLIAENGYKEQNIIKGGIDLMAGYQTYIFQRLTIDFYGGVGFHIASFSDEKGRKYSRAITDYGFTGPMLIGGLRFGAHLK